MKEIIQHGLDQLKRISVSPTEDKKGHQQRPNEKYEGPNTWDGK